MATRVKSFRLNIEDDTIEQGDALTLGENGEIETAHIGTASALDAGTSVGNVPVILNTGKLDPSLTPTVNNGTVIINQGGQQKGTFTLNQSGSTTIALDNQNIQAGQGIVIGQDEVLSVKYDSGTMKLNSDNTLAVNTDIIPVTSVAGKEGDVTIEYTDIEGRPTIINNTSSTSENDALSAKMGKSLQDQINNLSSIGKFLSIWNCTTGLPQTDPETLPYTYHTGDYFIVGTASVGGVNYRPNTGQYTGEASTVVETLPIEVPDVYVYDGTGWLIQNNTGTIAIDEELSTTSTNPVENRVITTEILKKIDKVTTASQIYATTGAGAQTTISYSTSATANTIAQRGTGGVLSVGTPTTDAHATTKKYVDDALALKQGKLPTGSNNQFLHTNSDTGALERVGVASIGVLSAGRGIVYDSNEICVDYDSDTIGLDNNGKLTATPGLANKLNKTTSASKLYGTDASGNQATITYDGDATASTIPYRGTNGVISVGTPTTDTHAATKKYVDDLFAEAGAIDDVKVDGVSVVTNKVANIPLNSKQDKLPNVVNNKFLHTNSSTGALEWSDAGQVDDVKVNNVSVVTNKIANINITPVNNSKITLMQDTALVGEFNLNQNSNKTLTIDLSGKQDNLVSGTNIKTINSTSLLGSGDISINEVPSGGTVGQVLTKTSSGVGWGNMSVGDMKYEDFEFTQPTGNTVTLSLSTEIEPTANFTVNAPSTVKEGQAYILRATNGATPYTMTLGTGINNPSDVDITLTANAIDQFAFLGLSDGTLELQPGGGDSLPDQTGNAGKFLQTNGTEASWQDVNEFMTQAEYDALPATKTSDNKTYFIYEVEA